MAEIRREARRRNVEGVALARGRLRLSRPVSASSGGRPVGAPLAPRVFVHPRRKSKLSRANDLLATKFNPTLAWRGRPRASRSLRLPPVRSRATRSAARLDCCSLARSPVRSLPPVCLPARTRILWAAAASCMAAAVGSRRRIGHPDFALSFGASSGGGGDLLQLRVPLPRPATTSTPSAYLTNPSVPFGGKEMPIPITGNEPAPDYINALMGNFRELLVGLEDEGDRVRDRLAKLHSGNSTSTIPTDSTPPTSDTADFPILRTTRRSTTLPLPQPTPQPPPVRPPRQRDFVRRNRDNNAQRSISRHQLARDKSRTMTSTVTSRGALIVLEGLDRVGKSTLAKRLVDHLEKLRTPVTYCRFPDRTTPVGRLIDEYLKSSSKQVDDHVMHLLFSANRWELSRRIRNTVCQGTSVIVDRYSYSGIAYSSAKSDASVKWCCETERGLPRPDLVIYLELKSEAQRQRDGFGEERFETKEMQDSVRLQYEQVMDMSKETWLKIDVENKKPDQVLAEVILPVKRCLESSASKALGTLDFFDLSSQA